MIVVTTPYVPGHRIAESKGMVFGLVVRSFRPTDERFEDPTTRRRMRVWADPTSGERRYVAED